MFSTNLINGFDARAKSLKTKLYLLLLQTFKGHIITKNVQKNIF